MYNHREFQDMNTIYHKLITSLVGAALLFGACTKSDIPTYDTVHNAVRFSNSFNGEDPGYNHTTQEFNTGFSFITNQTLKSYDHSIQLVLVGSPVDKDLKVNVEVNKEKTTAPDGTYEIVSASIPKGKLYGTVIVRLHNTPELATEDYTLALTLKSSRDLAAGPAEYINANIVWGKRIPAPTHSQHIQTYNMLIEGTAYFRDSSLDYFSPAALAVIVDALGWDDWDDPNVHGALYNNAQFLYYKYLPRGRHLTAGEAYKGYAMIIGEYIDRYNKANPDAPLIHDAGLNKGNPIKARTNF